MAKRSSWGETVFYCLFLFLLRAQIQHDPGKLGVVGHGLLKDVNRVENQERAIVSEHQDPCVRHDAKI